MHSKWTRRLGLAALFGLVIWTSVGCAQERAPINQVQANALSKHFFVGANLSDTSDDPEFYMRNTVVDVPYGAQQDGLFTASYAQPLNRVKWEISETSLIARQTYEMIQNSDYHGARITNNGQVVAMFTITSHFDIRRSYNPQTGEETNIITENTTDRPWYQREYMRVDWSKNLVTDGYQVDTLSMIGVIGGVKFDPESYFIDDPADPNAPVFVQDEGYFDVTTKAYATPQIINTPFGTFPACFLPADYGGTGPVSNCNPTEVTLRLAFKQVGNRDYEPIDWNGNRQDAFGWFTQDRYGYTRNYGVLDENWHRFASRYNIWAKSHVDDTQCAVDYWRDANGNVQQYKTDGSGQFLLDKTTGLPVAASPNDKNTAPFTGPPIAGTVPASNIGLDVHRDTDKDGTEDACQFTDAGGNVINPGSRCDEFSNKCTIPTYARTVKTIPWYYGPDSAPDLFASTANALGQWNLAVKRAAQIGKMVEANRVGIDGSQFLTAEQDLIADAQNSAKQTVPDVFVLCHNPTIDSDPAACTPNGKQVYARLGDIRYNLVEIMPNPQVPSPWGIMVDADDPLTGEKVATSVNEWGAVLDIASQSVEDLLRWINGEITDQQIASGQYLHDWAKASKLSTVQYQPQVLSAHEIQSRLNSLDTTLAKINGLTAKDRTLPVPIRVQKAGQTLATTLGPSLNTTFEAHRQALIGSPAEMSLITPGQLEGAGMDPRTQLAGNDAAIAAASPLRGMNPELNRWIRHSRDLTMAKNAQCMVEQPEPDSLVGMARQAQRLYGKLCGNGVTCDTGDLNVNDPNYPALKYSRDQKIHQWIREQFHISVIAHEMGHSMGLRHNFTGSIDSLNYHTQYWQLRTRNGQEKYCGFKGNPWTDELDYTTPHTNGTDCVGPRWVDPVTDTEVNGLIWKWGSSTVMDYPGDNTQDMNDIGLYDKAAMRFGYAQVVDVDHDAVYSGANFDNATGRAMDKASSYGMVLDGFGGISGQTVGGWHYSTYNEKFGVLGTCTAQTDPNDPLSATCSGPQLDYAAARDMQTVSKFGDVYLTVRPDLVANFGVYVGPDGVKRMRHPYMFGSDEFADIGNVPVYRFDAGADSYEQFQFLISTYENRYIFDNFRRDRSTFSSVTQLHRAEDRYLDKIQQMTKSLALMVGLGVSTTDPGSMLPLVMGASDGFAMFARILTRPEAGPYAVQNPAQSGYPLPFAQAEDLNLGAQINDPQGDFDVALGSGEGRYLYNDYDYTQGYYWSDYQTKLGSYYEKRQAIYYLTEAYNEFVSNTPQDYIDGRYKNLNYSSLYPNQMRRLFAQMMQNNPMSYGPYIIAPSTLGTTVHVQYMPWEKYDPTDMTTINLDYPKGGVVMDPLVGWEEQYPSIFHAFFYGPTTLTMDWVDQMRIYSPGGGDTVTIPFAQQLAYMDPNTGIEYVARNYGMETINSAYGGPVAKTSGARMIQYANEVAAKTYQITGTDARGEYTYALDANGNPICVDPNTCAANAAILRNYSANLDTVRQLAFQFGYGPLGHCQPNDPGCFNP